MHTHTQMDFADTLTDELLDLRENCTTRHQEPFVAASGGYRLAGSENANLGASGASPSDLHAKRSLSFSDFAQAPAKPLGSLLSPGAPR